MPNWHFKFATSCGASSNRSLHVQLALDAELLDAFAQRCARDAQQLRGVDLVVVRFLERLDDELALDGGNDFQFRIAPGPLEQLSRQRGGVRGRGFAGSRRRRRGAAATLAGDFRGQVAFPDRVAFCHDVRAADGVLQFAHIARPMIFSQRLDDIGGNGFRLPLLFARNFFQKIVHQQRNVPAPVAERRNVDAHDVEPLKQVLAELFRGHGGFERLVRRGNDAHVGLNRLVAADALEGAALQHAQNFRLRSGRHVADFVQTNRAVDGFLEFADALHCGAGERAAFMAEEFALEQLFGNRGAIDRKKRLLATVAVMINRAGDEFLAGAAFTGDERGGVAGGHLTDELENLLHRLTATDDAEFVILGFEQRLIRHDLLHVVCGLERVGDDFLELQRVERLEQIIVGAELHRLNGRLRRAVGGHQNDEELRIGGADPAERFESVHTAHAHIHEHEVGLEFGNDLQPFLAGRCRGQFDFRRIKDSLERIPHILFVINQQQLAHWPVNIAKTGKRNKEFLKRIFNLNSHGGWCDYSIVYKSNLNYYEKKCYVQPAGLAGGTAPRGGFP